jgi:hypothetical protein
MVEEKKIKNSNGVKISESRVVSKLHEIGDMGRVLYGTRLVYTEETT